MDLPVLIFGFFLVGGITAAVAKLKRRDPLLWFLFGAALFIVALPVVLLLPEGDVRRGRNAPQKFCPYCGAGLDGGQMHCPQCRRLQPDIGAATGSSWERTVAGDDEVAKWTRQKEQYVPRLKSAPTSTEIHFECPKCQQRMSGHEVLQFNEVDCPSCGDKFKPVPIDLDK